MTNFEENLKTWCNVDLDAVAHNFKYARSKTDAAVICVVKASAYGHGAVMVSRRLEQEGCKYFAVSSIEEALELRNGGIKSCILVLGYILPQNLEDAVENDISFACASIDFAKILCGMSFKKKAKVHIKINTGMNRTGFAVCHDKGADDLKEAARLLGECDNIEIEGIFSHFANAEDDMEFSHTQYDNFKMALMMVKDEGIEPEMVHICNSAGTEKYESMHHDAVRVGIHLYGCESSDENFVPTIDFCTRVVDVHYITKGEGVSYGLDFVAQKQTKIAVIGAGYADGLFRCLSNGKGDVLVNGKVCKIVGRVCMDMTMVDVTDVEVKVGDKVVIWGREHSVERQASNAGTISYELMCALSPRVTRVYI